MLYEVITLSHNRIPAITEIVAYPDEIITHGSPMQLRQKYSMDKESIAYRAEKLLSERKTNGELRLKEEDGIQ